MSNFLKRFTNYLYEFQTSEKYISNYSQILQKLKKTKSTQGGERGEIVVGCFVLAFVCQGHMHRHDCLLDAKAERTHAQGRIARTHTPA